jgi:hypothetical protein
MSTMATDPIEELRAATRELDRSDDRCAQLLAELEAERKNRPLLEQKVRDAAARLSSNGMSTRVAAAIAKKQEPPKSTPERSERRIPLAVPPRYLKILEHVDGARDLSTLVKRIRGDRDDVEQARASMSSDLSRMKNLGLVESVHRGVYRRTQQGEHALGGTH